jgi:hypothetical protein
MDMPDKAQVNLVDFNKLPHGPAAAPDADEGPVPDTVRRGVGDENRYRGARYLPVSGCQIFIKLFLGVFACGIHRRLAGAPDPEKAYAVDDLPLPVQAVPPAFKETAYLVTVPVSMHTDYLPGMPLNAGKDIFGRFPVAAFGEITAQRHQINGPDKISGSVKIFFFAMNVANSQYLHIISCNPLWLKLEKIQQLIKLAAKHPPQVRDGPAWCLFLKGFAPYHLLLNIQFAENLLSILYLQL